MASEQFDHSRSTLRALLSKPLSAIALFTVLLFFLTALCVEGYSVYCHFAEITPTYQLENFADRFLPPSSRHLLGTDYLGRDVLSRAVASTSTAMKVGIIAGLITALIGVSAGVIGGYYGGKVDEVVVWIYSSFASMPTLLFILGFALLVSRGYLSSTLQAPFDFSAKMLNVEPGMLGIYLAIGLTGWDTLCRVVRAETMKLKKKPYVAAARVNGGGDLHIMLRHIVPNLFHLAIIYFTLRFGYAIMTEVIVSFLGIGAQNTPSWGLMIANGQERLWRGVWWEVGAATLFMFVLVLALNVLGDALRDILDPKNKEVN